MPGYTIEIEEENANVKDILCILCLLLLRAPVQTPCGHRCCLSCVKKARGSSNSFKCPIDGTDVTEVFPDRFVEREILNLRCKCEFWRMGCNWAGLVKHYEDHVELCNFTKVKCPLEGCEETVSKAVLEDHMSKCDYRREQCIDCGENVTILRLRKHQQTTCAGAKIKCSYCGKDVLRGQLDAHVEHECSEVPAPCPFTKIGCAATKAMKKNEKRKHMENAQMVHITYMLNFVLDLGQRMSGVMEPGSSTTDAAHESMEVDICSAIPTAHKKLPQASSQRPWTPSTRVKTIVSDSSPDQRYASLPSDMPGSSRNASGLSNVIDELTGKINAIELQTTIKLEKLSRSFDALMDSVKRIERRLASYDEVERNMAVNLADLKERFDYMDNASYSGVLVWPITGFTAKRHDAIVGKTNSLYSPFFYTGPHGYKMRLRVYLNGDGMGKGTHISLFFVLCKGNYDALLPWPFRQKVKLMILDQECKKNVSESFKPDPSSSSFQKPKKLMNIASGCPLFMPLSLLDTEAYVRDDTLFLKAEVDASN